MIRQKTATIVALIKKQADGVALAETHLEFHTVLADDEAFRSGSARVELWRGFSSGCATDVTGKGFVIETRGERREARG